MYVRIHSVNFGVNRRRPGRRSDSLLHGLTPMPGPGPCTQPPPTIVYLRDIGGASVDDEPAVTKSSGSRKDTNQPAARCRDAGPQSDQRLRQPSVSNLSSPILREVLSKTSPALTAAYKDLDAFKPAATPPSRPNIAPHGQDIETAQELLMVAR